MSILCVLHSVENTFGSGADTSYFHSEASLHLAAKLIRPYLGALSRSIGLVTIRPDGVGSPRIYNNNLNRPRTWIRTL